MLKNIYKRPKTRFIIVLVCIIQTIFFFAFDKEALAEVSCPANIITPGEQPQVFCASLNVVPDKGPGDTNFTLEGYNCEDIGTYYRLSVFDFEGLPTFAAPQIYLTDADMDGQKDDIIASISLDIMQTPGIFTAKLFAPYTNPLGEMYVGMQCDNFEVTSTIVPATCCAIPITDPLFCGPPLGCKDVGSNDPNVCPQECPPVRNYCTSEVWTCGSPQPPVGCAGKYTKLPGECYFVNCPQGYFPDGFIPDVCDNFWVDYKTTCCVSITASLAAKTSRPSIDPLCGSKGINTAIGCVPMNSNMAFISFLLTWSIGVGAGIAFLGIVFSGFLVMSSGGDKERLKTGKELFVSSLGGLLLIIFSVYLLDVIGVRIIKFPGL